MGVYSSSDEVPSDSKVRTYLEPSETKNESSNLLLWTTIATIMIAIDTTAAMQIPTIVFLLIQY